MRDAIATAAAIRSGEVTAREVVEASIAAIEQHHGALNAVVGTRYEEALAEVDAGLPDGPLTGVPFLVKDLGAEVAGMPSTRGSRLWADHVAERDSELVRRYRAAGLVVLGTTNTPELGKNASTEPQLFGPTHNPWRRDMSPGGSSGGSAAAVSAGLVPVAHGNDGGGSIRIPAAACGLFGLKPSRGRIPLAPSPTTLAGPVSASHALTTTVRDSALLLDIGAGPLPGDAFGVRQPRTTFLDAVDRDPGSLRIGVVTEVDGVTTDAQCVAAVRRAAELCASLGHRVSEIAAPWTVAGVGPSSAVLMGADLVVSVEDRLAALGRELREDDLEPFTRLLLEHYRGISGPDVNRALRRLQQIGWEVGAAFEAYDVLVMPTLAQPTPPHGLLDTTRSETIYEHATTYSAWTSVFNVTGMPGMSMPLAADDTGLPIGVQFVADLAGEETLLSLAGQVEAAAPWRRLAPGYGE